MTPEELEPAPLTPEKAEAISKEALDKFPPVDGYDFEQQCSRLGYITAATKYTALLIDLQERYDHLTGVYENQTANSPASPPKTNSHYFFTTI